MKSVKIKLDQLNQNKSNKLRSILTDLELVAKDYLSVKEHELETKQYQPFKEH